VPEGEIVLDPPPHLGQHEGASGVLMNAIPMLGGLGSMVLVAGLGGSGGSGRSYLAAGTFLCASLAFVLVQLDRQRVQRLHKASSARARYLTYLAVVREAVREAADRQRGALTWQHPAPEALPALAEERSRVWERHSSDQQFLHVRYGRCAQRLSIELVAPETTDDQSDPAAAAALHRLLLAHRTQADLPTSIDVRAFHRVEVCGPQDQARALARAIVCSAAAFHSPDDLAIAVLTSERHLAHWDWVKWLPHAHSTVRTDAIGPMRMVSASPDHLATLLPGGLDDRARFGTDERSSGPHLLVVVDGASPPPDHPVVRLDGLQGVTVLDLPASWGRLDEAACLRLLFDADAGVAGRLPLTALALHAAPATALADQCDLPTAEAFARRLAPLHTVTAGASGASGVDVTGPTDFLDLLGLGDVQGFDPALTWRQRPARDLLRVPIGLGNGGHVVHLDIKEPAQQGMGPHGLVIGATGSGKSEFLRTLVLGLAMTHSPEQLNLVLVDFKGGATFAGMSGMPHVSAVITNLAEELTLVDRMHDALSGEMVRRQELLREAGNYASVRDYESARAAGAPLEPMPSLFIVVDEFSEMLSAKPEFIDLFVAIGRLGRSLGLHLLLASQRLEEGRLRGLESHLSYRVGLRTFSAAESRAVLGVPDAYELPPSPGLGFLKPDQSTLVRFKAAYVSGPPAVRAHARRDEDETPYGILPFTSSEVRTIDSSAAGTPAPDHQGGQASLLDIAVRTMATHGPAAHQVWLPPLDLPDTLDDLMPDLVEDPALGLVSPRWRRLGGLKLPIGTVDRPREQRRDILTVDLAGATGHAVVVGGPRSGKSTLLRTLVTSLALTTTPLESQLYVMDFGGGTFAPLAGLPHVAGVGSRSEPDVVRRIVAEVTGIVDRREAFFRAQGIDSIETYRLRRAQGRVDDGYGDVYLVVDGWSTLHADFEDIELHLHHLAGRGLTFGVHLLVASSRWADFRASMRDTFGIRIELRLGEPIDSEIDRRIAAQVPAGRPGRGLVASKLHFLAALPRIDGDPGADTLGEGVEGLIARVSAAWRGPQAPKLRLLPDHVELSSLVSSVPHDDKRLLLGVNEKELAPVGLEADTQPHLLIYGDGKSGKSATLRAYIREVTRTRSPREAQLVVVDYRRSLLGEVPEDHLLSYLTSAPQTSPTITELATFLESRLPGPDVGPTQLRTRSWWRGPEVYVVVDDYDLVATQQSSPIAPLQPLLAQSRDVGLHLVVARRSGGAGRASYEPVLQAMRELAMPGLVLSGSPDEGVLIGTIKPQPLPPGRGRLWTREHGVETVQVAWTDPAI
jgi:S-DNA-T family DNA segregation ATPase FtsK/SpoIIIE